MPGALAKLNGTELPALLPRLDLSPLAADAVRGCHTVSEALHALEQAGRVAEAARLTAHALPRREGVWWACMCAAHTAPPDLPEADRVAREAAEAWVRQPSEARRRQAMERSQAAGCRSPEAWSGVAAFWSSGSMAPEGLPEVPAPPHLAATAIAGAVALAAVRRDAAMRERRLRRFLDAARDIADGGSGRMQPEGR